MSNRNRGRDYVYDEMYSRHLNGDRARYNPNPAGQRTAVIQRMYYRILTELAANRFKWEGMPDTVDVRFMEMTLYYNALSVFYFDKDYDKFFAMKGTPASQVNMFDNPTRFFVTGPGFVGKYLNAVNRVLKVNNEVEMLDAECVPIWANYMRVPDLDIVLIYASKFAELDVTIEINSKNARRNKVIVVDENQKLSGVNIVREIDNGSPLIQVSQSLGNMITALDLGVDPDAIEKLHILKGRLWNECMTLLGINNANQDKKERLVASEVDANDDQVESTRAVNLNARKMAADAINKRYGLNLSVSYHTDIQPELDGMVTGQFSENMQSEDEEI